MMALVRRTRNSSLCWQDACDLLKATANRHGLLCRELPPKLYGDPALCSIVTSRKHLSLILKPEGELRITYKALPNFETLVCNLLDVPASYIERLCERFP